MHPVTGMTLVQKQSHKVSRESTVMPRPRLPHLHRQVTRHGRTVWYVRIDKGQRIRLTAPFGSDAFTEQYRLAGLGPAPADTARARQPSKGSLAWLWKQYRATGAWTDLSM